MSARNSSLIAPALWLAACGAAPSQRAPGPSGQVCADNFNERICCAPSIATTPTVVSTSEACAADGLCPIVSSAVDFATHDVVMGSPTAFGIGFELRGPPTTIGTEWRIYRRLEVVCASPGAAGITLRASADAGGGSVAYWAAVPKLAGADMKCVCSRGDTPRP
jgi:hypothetical protein